MDHYGTLAGALEYHAVSAGGAAWSAPTVKDTERTAALIRASRSLDGQYGDRFPGSPTGGRSQRLAWPRKDAYDNCQIPPEKLPDDTVPWEIDQAAYAMALVELLTPGATSPNFTPSEVYKRERVEGAVEVERFGPNDGMALTLDMQRQQMAEVEDSLRCLFSAKGTTQWVLRV